MELRNEFLSDDSFKYDDVNYSWLLCKNIFRCVCNHHAPLHTCRIKGRNKPLINGDIIRAMYPRDYMYMYVVKRAIQLE